MNILWIQTDEQSTQTLGCYGNPFDPTPNLDALARRGVRFDNHFVQSPVCVPSRVSELCGCYPHQTGVLDNSVHYTQGVWPEGLVAFPERFAAAGYQTANLGKTHTPNHDTWQECWHFEQFACTWYNELRPGWDEEDHDILHLGNEEKGIILSGVHPEMPYGRNPQSFLADRCLDWLAARDPAKPFFLRCSFLAPHSPVLPDRNAYARFNPDDMPWQRPSEDEIAARPDFERGTLFDALDAHSDAEIRRMRASYLGLVNEVDRQVGRLLSSLEEKGLLEETLIVFSSDHGNLMGEHGWFQKNVFYDTTCRVPMIMAGPGIPAGETVQRLTEAVDTAPTLIRLGGLQTQKQYAGMDLLRPGTPREHVTGETFSRNRRRAWVRTREWSMDWNIHEEGDPLSNPAEKDGKLNNLVDDPQQTRNLYADPNLSGVIRQLEARFHDRTRERRRPIQRPKTP
jgi:choline-sulfatase